MKKLIGIICILCMFAGCGISEEAYTDNESSEEQIAVVETTEEDEEDEMNINFVLCKTESVTEEKAILFCESKEIYFELTPEQSEGLVEGEYYTVKYYESQSVSENTFTLTDPVITKALLEDKGPAL